MDTGTSVSAVTESIKHLTHRYRQLYEQGVSLERLRQYVVRWCYWLWSGLQGRVSRERGVNHYWVLLQAKTTLDSGKNQVLSVNNARLLSYEPL
jgi:hypothetical protein